MTFEEVLKMHGVHNHVDAIFIADGSGTVVGKPCGYAVYTHLKSGEALWLEGGSTTGTNNLAELSPFLLALWHYQKLLGKELRRIAMVTDSELTVKCGNRENGRAANLGLWASIDYYADQVTELYWHWRPRRSTDILAECDDRAGKYRLSCQTE